jgi:Cupin domain
MTDTKSYSYATHLDIKFPSLDLIDVEALAKSVTDQWYNQTLCRVNDSVVRLGVMQGEYHWHKHDNDDEFFFVLSGRFIVDLEARSVDLLPGQGFVVHAPVHLGNPRRVATRARRGVIMMRWFGSSCQSTGAAPD